jgi:hypothetical protein
MKQNVSTLHDIATPSSHGFTKGLYRRTKQNTYLTFTSLQHKFLNPIENIGLSSSKSVWMVVVVCSSCGHGGAGCDNSFFYPLWGHMKTNTALVLTIHKEKGSIINMPLSRLLWSFKTQEMCCLLVYITDNMIQHSSEYQTMTQNFCFHRGCKSEPQHTHTQTHTHAHNWWTICTQ